jgi:16S rRNA (adenine1518-N6/adenine1519-N6)-dimethyltransferase
VPHSRLASPSATIDVLKRYDLFTRKSLGQHFLVDDNVIGRILELAAIQPGEPVLEIGPGIGTLTDALLAEGAVVTAIERDERLLPALADLAAGHAGTGPSGTLTVVSGDAVSVPVASLGAPRALVANLPYAVAATVVLRFFEELASLERAVVMVQAEVADRIAGVPGTKAYGAYTVKLALHAAVTGRFAVARSCFLPPPRVDSAVVRLERVERTEAPAVIVAAARAAEAAFSQRRKTLRNALGSGLGTTVSDAQRILDEADIDGSLRAENLAVEEYLRLGRVLHERAARR